MGFGHFWEFLGWVEFRFWVWVLILFACLVLLCFWYFENLVSSVAVWCFQKALVVLVCYKPDPFWDLFIFGVLNLWRIFGFAEIGFVLVSGCSGCVCVSFRQLLLYGLCKCFWWIFVMLAV